MLSSLLAIVVPTFGIVAVGWFCGRRGIFNRDAIHGLNAYAYIIALPALIFESTFAQAVRARLTGDDVRYLLGIVLAHLVVLGAAVLILRAARREVRALGPMLLTFGSTAYLGIPFATFAFGARGTAYAALGSTALVVTVLFASLLVLNRHGRVEQWEKGSARPLLGRGRGRTGEPPMKTSIRREAPAATWHQLLELPFLWVVLLGILLPLLGVRALPEFVSRTVAILAGSAGPTALLALGAFQSDLTLARIPWRWAIPLGIGKVILPTAVTVVILGAFGIRGLPLAVGASLAATSLAVTAFVLSDEYRIGRELTAGALIVSTLASLVVLSLVAFLWISGAFA